MKPDLTYIFAYGSLRSDLGAYSRPQYGTKVVARGRVKGSLHVMATAGVPCMLWAGAKERPKDPESTVYGEVMTVRFKSVLHALDRREYFYYRTRVDCECEDGRVRKVWVYWGDLLLKPAKFIDDVPDGDWGNLIKELLPCEKWWHYQDQIHFRYRMQLLEFQRHVYSEFAQEHQGRTSGHQPGSRGQSGAPAAIPSRSGW